MFTKESLAKFINSYEEVYNGKKLVIGPHIVVRGSQKNYAQFLNYNFSFKPDNIWFEDAIAKAILFSSAEKVYGVKPNAIGDMRYITVPYSLAWLGFKLDYKLDLYKIWKQQSLSVTLKTKLHEVMSKIEDYVKTKAPGSLYGEWAKKEECWNAIKNESFEIDLESLKSDLENKLSEKRKKLTEDEVESQLIQAEVDFIKSIPIAKWLEISKIGLEIEDMTQHLKDRAINIQSSLRLNKQLSENQRKDAIKIIENILASSPNFFDEASEPSRMLEAKSNNKINTDLLTKMVVWDTKAKVLSAKELQYIADFAYGLKTLNDFHEKNIKRHLSRLQDAGFKA
jgi:hypothetical protein